MPSAARSPSLESLEHRLLCARTPSDPTPATLGRAFDLGERQVLLARMTGLPKRTSVALARYLKGHHTAAFDAYLLTYMRGRGGAKYYFDPADAGTLASYVSTHFGYDSQITRADAVTDSRLFPQESSSSKYTVQLPNRINWNDASPSSDTEFLPTLQRQAWWTDLAQVYRYTGQAKYMNELQYELASWSQQTPTFTPTHDHEITYAFTVGIRVASQIQAYFAVLDSSGWTGAANSLLLYKLMQQGDLLNTVVTHFDDSDSNRSVAIGSSEQFLGELFPEFDTAAAWEKTGRGQVFESLNAQFYSDGSHREQSPGYALNVLDNFLDDRELDKVNGVVWDTDDQNTLVNAVTALWQQLSPNGDRPAIGDTDRLSGNGKFSKATVVLGVNQWPQNRFNNSDVWEFGTAAASTRLHDTTDNLGARGSTYSLPDSGNYVLRSDNSANARQINYIDGPKGGGHGHFDYMSFELFGYGRPLIADPGPYRYDTSAARQWVVSAAAHNTISVAGTNPADLEDASSFLNSGITPVAGGSMMSSSYQGYGFLDGNPTLSRSIWYDGNNTMVIVDFASASSKTAFETGFTVEGQTTKQNLANGTLYTTNGTGNVRIQSLLNPHQTAAIRTKGVFTSSNPAPNDYDPATHYYASHSGTFAVFATVITAYQGSAATAVNDVSWARVPTKAGQTAILNVNGQRITFVGPQFAKVGADGAVKGEDNSLAYDSKGRLNMVFYDPTSQTLKYAVRSTKGVWGDIQTIDGNVGSGITPSLVIDSQDYAHVAYQNGPSADLKYAYVSSETNSWVVTTVDAHGATGAYPSLALSRKDGAIIAYYDKTHGDLKVATQESSGFSITTVDGRGDVGRFASIKLDPNRTDSSKYAIAYEDSTHGTLKYAIQSKNSYLIETIDKQSANGGGYVSMQFFDDGDEYEPAVSYYDSGTGHLKFAARHGGVWSSTVIAKGRRQGLYSQLEIIKDQPYVFYFDGVHNTANELVGSRVVNAHWSSKTVANGGRDLSTAVYGTHIAFSTYDTRTGYLTIAG